MLKINGAGKEKRATDLTDVVPRMKAEVDWHIAELLKKKSKKHQLGEDLLNQVMAFKHLYKNHFESVIHHGHKRSPMNTYCNMQKMPAKP
ncbi:hypothetical protein ACEQPO_16895 [Bacillus sp. SL00103]